MKWKNLKIGTKIGGGFSVILIVLAVVGYLSYSGVGGIVSNATTVILGTKLAGSLTQNEVDHLVWAEELNKLLTDNQVTTLDIETDDHGFGNGCQGHIRLSNGARGRMNDIDSYFIR